jgi:hypothetical protein
MPRLTANQRKNLVVAIATALVIGFSTWISFDPDNYFFYRQADRQHWHHPTAHFLIVCGLYIAEAFCVAIAIKLRASVRLWPRTMIATLIFLPWVAFSSMFVVHAPVYLHVHIIWTWLLLAVLIMVTLVSVIRHVIGSIRGTSNAV